MLAHSGGAVPKHVQWTALDVRAVRILYNQVRISRELTQRLFDEIAAYNAENPDAEILAAESPPPPHCPPLEALLAVIDRADITKPISSSFLNENWSQDDWFETSEQQQLALRMIDERLAWTAQPTAAILDRFRRLFVNSSRNVDEAVQAYEQGLRRTAKVVKSIVV
jgi:hypothetical protein